MASCVFNLHLRGGIEGFTDLQLDSWLSLESKHSAGKISCNALEWNRHVLWTLLGEKNVSKVTFASEGGITKMHQIYLRDDEFVSCSVCFTSSIGHRCGWYRTQSVILHFDLKKGSESWYCRFKSPKFTFSHNNLCFYPVSKLRWNEKSPSLSSPACSCFSDSVF